MNKPSKVEKVITVKGRENMNLRYYQTFNNGITLLSPKETYQIEVNFNYGLFGLLYAISVLVSCNSVAP